MLRTPARVIPFLDALYRPPQWIGSFADDTTVCRCEEMSVGRVREMARLASHDLPVEMKITAAVA